jgi:lipopolysaccharide biosynthesis glycosyltransferase
MTAYFPIILAFDGNYAKYAAVSIFSLLVHSTKKVKVYCIVTSASEEQLRPIEALSAKFATDIVFLHADIDTFSGWRTIGHIKLATYLRLLAPDLVAEETALYLDSDIVVTTDLSELFETRMDDAYIAGRFDEIGARSSKMPLAPGDPYLNAGVLLMNLEALRRDRFLDRCVEIHTQYEKEATWLEQCVINKFAEGRKAVIDKKWNVLVNQFEQGNCESAIAPYDRQGIIHFNTVAKPWMQWSDSYVARLWFNYARFVDVPYKDLFIEASSINDLVTWARVLDKEGNVQAAAGVKNMLINLFLRPGDGK